MTKKITPNFLRQFLVLIIFSKSLFFFSQNNVYLNVNWPSYSGENKMEILNSSNSVVLSIENNFGNGANTSFLNQTSSTVSLPNGNYTVRVYDNYGDDWNGTAPYGKVFVNGAEEFYFDGDFTNNASANTQIQLDFSLGIGLDDASFTYPNSSYYISDTDPTPTITGESGGTFTATSGLVINSTSGKIDVSESTLGNHTVTYTTTAPDQNSTQQNITISFATSQYYSSSKKYIEYIPGTMPVIISAPHGGVLTGSELTTRSCGTGEMDDNTDILIREIQKSCYEQFGVYPYIIINNLRRNKLDPNRTKSIATCGNASAEPYFDAYHNFIDVASADVNNKFGKGLYIDLHGQSHSIPRVEAGYNLASSSYDENLNNTATNSVELSRVTIKNLIENNLQNLTFEDLIRGSQSFGGLLQTTGGSEYTALGHAGCSRTEGYRTVPSHIGNGNQGSCDDTNPGSNSYFAGDYYSNIRHGSGNTSTANTVVGGGGSVNGGGGTIDGIMTEVNRRVRDLGNFYSSTYGRTDTRSATVPYFARDYAKVIEKYIDLHYNNFSKFSYANSSYDVLSADPTPTILGISGGTFSSTTGLSINATSGVIDTSLSEAGTYTISYTAPNVGEYYKKETTITITASVELNEFLPTSGNWSEIGNWSKNRVPVTTDYVVIPSTKTATLNLENQIINDLTVQGNFTINADKSLTVNGNLTNSGTFNINSGGSLIVGGTSTGNLTYHRYLNANTWYLIGVPLTGQSVSDFAQNHPNLSKGTGIGDDQNIAFGYYDNTQNISSNRWKYYKKGQVDGIGGDDTTDNLVAGLGYTTRLSTAGNLSFTGVLQTENLLKNVSQGKSSFNLISNPYPSYLSSSEFLPANVGIGKSLKTQTLWVWDQTLNGGVGDYATKITLQDFKIAPGQAFFVEANNNSNINFSKNSLSHQNTDTFLKSSRPEIKLSIKDGVNNKFTEIYYIERATIGFDDGFDGEIFGGVSSTFQIYTGLIEGPLNKKLSIQSIPNNNYENMVIPIGVNATNGSEITFSSENINIPDNLNVYIEDKANKILTKLDDSSNYKTILSSNLNGFGNFYIHTKPANTLSTKEDFREIINIYKTALNSLIIYGLFDDKINIELYTILGKKVFETTFPSKGKTEIKLPKVTSGLYFVKVNCKNKEINKKIILD